MTPVGSGTMLQFRVRDRMVIVKLTWCVACVNLANILVRQLGDNNAVTQHENSQLSTFSDNSAREHQILLDEMLARELSGEDGAPQSAEVFTDHVVGPADSRIGGAEISEIVSLPTFRFSKQTMSCTQMSNGKCMVCQCDF